MPDTPKIEKHVTAKYVGHKIKIDGVYYYSCISKERFLAAPHMQEKRMKNSYKCMERTRDLGWTTPTSIPPEMVTKNSIILQCAYCSAYKDFRKRDADGKVPIIGKTPCECRKAA